jgi:excisionase family DNA binding protein
MPVQDQSMTIPEAARALGLSVDAVRKRIRRGQLPAQKAAGVWRVRVDTPAGPRPGPDQGGSRTSPADIQELSRRVRWLETRLEKAEEERGELRRLLLLSEQNVSALRQLAAGPPPAPTFTVPAGPDSTAVEPPRRRWWWPFMRA